MKKLALILAFMIIPCTAFGLEMLTDSSMDSITGQDGVSIMADDIQLFLNVDLFAYADTDGYDLHNGCSATGCNSGAMVAFQNFQMDVININAIIGSDNDGAGGRVYNTNFVMDTNPALVSTSCGIPLFYDYADTAPWSTCISTCLTARLGLTVGTKGLDNYTESMFYINGSAVTGNVFVPQALSIDLTDELPVFSQGFAYLMSSPYKMMGVIITLPTMEIYIQDMHFDISMYDLNCDTWVFNGGNGYTDIDSNNNDFGQFLVQGVTFTVLGGWVEIGPH